MALRQTSTGLALSARQCAPCSSSAARPAGALALRHSPAAKLRQELLGASVPCRPAPARGCPPPSVARRGLVVEAAKRVSTGRSLVLNSTLVAEDGKAQDVEKLCADVLALAKNKQKDRASGIISFECHTDAYEGNVLYFWERYETFLHMNDFHASPDYEDFLRKVRPLLVQPVQLSAYEYNDGKIGCMLNPIGPKGEGGLDDATGQGGSGGGASYKQTSQSVSQGIGERDGWGLDNAVEFSTAQGAAQEAAAAIAKTFRSIFGAQEKN